MSGVNILQVSPGFFRLHQGGRQVGEAVVVRSGDKTIEHWYLFGAGMGSLPAGYNAYVWPGPQHPGVTTSYSYAGAAPPGWDPRDGSAYVATLGARLGPGLAVQYVVASCTAPPVRSAVASNGAARTAAKKKAKTSRKKKG